MKITLRKTFCLLVFLPNLVFSQFLEQKEFTWPDKFVDYKELPDSLKKNDAVILKEQLTITGNSIYRRVAIKILNQQGLDVFKKIQLPENFDLTGYPNFNKQGRFKDRHIPYISDYSIKYFASRIITPNKKIVDLSSEYNIEKLYWVNNAGIRIDDKAYNFKIDVLEIGDILEYTYSAVVIWDKIQNVIYPNGVYPKLDYNLRIEWMAKRDYTRNPSIYNYTYLKGINYSQNIPIGIILPNIQMTQNVKYNYSRRAYYGNPEELFINNGFQYKWKFDLDTFYNHSNDSYHISIRKFLQKFEENKTDTFNNVFLKQFTDSLNNLIYISIESSYYRNKTSYTPLFPDIFANRELGEINLLKNYDDILTERKVFFYDGIIIDKRLSAVNPKYRTHINLENTILVIPHKNVYRYVIPRYNGLKYILDELPFYYEGTTCALLPCLNCLGNTANNRMIMINTPSSTYYENERVEAAVFKVNTDSLKINAIIKENLKGQFSTILRHFYNKESIDSTINENYFKKCTDKPNAFNIKINPGLGSEIFPVSHSFHCSENLSPNNKITIDLHNWFSFTFKKEEYTEIPSHDFYFDFQYTDVYNFLFEFDKPIEITNANELTKNLSNDYFEVNSNLVKEEGNNYLLNVMVKVKQKALPEKDGAKLLEFVNTLDEINNFKLQLKQ